MKRTCAATGLRLLQAFRGDSGFRVVRDKYPPVSAVERQETDDRSSWSRYDTPGSTLYAAENSEIAYAEVLSGFKRKLGAHDALATDAAALGMSVSDFVESVARDWGDRGLMGLGALPRAWRSERAIHEILLPAEGWWIDIEHPDSIAAISETVAQGLAQEGVSSLTTATLRGEDRRVTTLIAQSLRSQVLDDGSTPVGVHFGSKHGGGWCKAVWMDPQAPGMAALSGVPILLSDAALERVTRRFGIRCF